MQPLDGSNRPNRGMNAGIDRATQDYVAQGHGSMRILPRVLRKSIRLASSVTLSGLAGSKILQVGVLGALVIGASGYFVVEHGGGKQVLASVTSSAGLEASKLVISGNNNLDLNMIQAQLGSSLGKTMFEFDVDVAREQVMQNPWIEKATVRKVYPDTIMVDVVEREPFALWKLDNAVNLISRDGRIIAAASPRHMRLPQIVGDGANQVAVEFLSVINRYPQIAERSDAYVRVGDRRWNLVIENGPRILLPEEGWQAALAELQELHTRKELLDRDVVQVDMRLPDRLIIKMRPDAAEIRKTAIREALKKKWHRT